MSAFAAITINSENLTFEGVEGEDLDVYYYGESATAPAFTVGASEVPEVVVNQATLPSWLESWDEEFNLYAYPAGAAGTYYVSATVTTADDTKEITFTFVISEASGAVVEKAEVDYIGQSGPARETCTIVTAGTTELTSGFYAVTNDVTIPSGTSITVSGEVSLILADGVTLTVTASNGTGIIVPSSSSLDIFCQAGGTGKLISTGGNRGAGIGGNAGKACGDVTIHGGEITAIGGNYGAGIGGGQRGNGGMVTINGGNVTATGGGTTDSNIGSGIGAGKGSSTHGTLTVGSNMEVKAGATSNPTTELTPDSEGRVTLSGERYYVITEKAVVEDWPADTSTVEGQTAAVAFGLDSESALANAGAKKLADWAKENSVSVDDVKSAGTTLVNAYLLNCANNAEAVAAAVETAKEAIKITKIEFDASGNPVLTYISEYGNGQVVLQGSVGIGASASWHDNQQPGDKFFRTILVP